MTLELALGNSDSLVSLLVLVTDLLLMMIAVGARKKIGRRTAATFGLVVTGIAALTVLNAFSEYSLDPLHVLGHSVYSAILLLCARLLVTQGVPPILDRLIFLELNAFDRFQYFLAQKTVFLFGRIHESLELNTFDRFQYALAQTTVSLAGSIRKIQTGSLNFNMVCFLVGFIICLLLILGFTSF